MFSPVTFSYDACSSKKRRKTETLKIENGELRTTVYPSNMAPIGTKLCQNAFQMIPNSQSSDAPKKLFDEIFACKNQHQIKKIAWFRAATNF